MRVLVEHRDLVVTTATGSGKTECFLVPVLAEMLQESARWSAPGLRPAAWDWWDDRHRTMQGQNPRYAPRALQRGHETRPAAVRALLLYPLNALVEDQLVRLRVALDSRDARDWLDAHRLGHRIYSAVTPAAPQFPEAVMGPRAVARRIAGSRSGCRGCGWVGRFAILPDTRRWRSRNVVPWICRMTLQIC